MGGSGVIHQGDTTEAWRAGYRRARKELVGSQHGINLRRLGPLGIDRVDRDASVLEVGCGDGNVLRSLRTLGFRRVVGLDLQPELVREAAGAAVGSAVELPVRSGSADVVVVMDVLHHLAPGDLPAALAELRRVVRRPGVVFVCEPADTTLRRVLGPALDGPLASLSAHTRAKREMVRLEWPTLGPWLAAERSVLERYRGAGFDVERVLRRPLRRSVRLVPGP